MYGEYLLRYDREYGDNPNVRPLLPQDFFHYIEEACIAVKVGDRVFRSSGAYYETGPASMEETYYEAGRVYYAHDLRVARYKRERARVGGCSAVPPLVPEPCAPGRVNIDQDKLDRELIDALKKLDDRVESHMWPDDAPATFNGVLKPSGGFLRIDLDNAPLSTRIEHDAIHSAVQVPVQTTCVVCGTHWDGPAPKDCPDPLAQFDDRDSPPLFAVCSIACYKALRRGIRLGNKIL